MRKIVIAMLWAFVCTCSYVSAQSKVFNEIAGSVRTDFSEITQNRKVMGYVRLVQLEKADKNTYNYKLNILDENLNDVSTAEFSDGYLTMNDVSFEGDVLCVNMNRGVNLYSGKSTAAVLYFINLEGKVLKIQTLENKETLPGLIKNIPGVGFVYENRAKTFSLLAYDVNGNKLWEKPLTKEIYYLAATPKMVSYYDLKDKSLNLMDAATGTGFYTKSLKNEDGCVHQFPGIDVYGDTVYYSGFTCPYNNGYAMKNKTLKRGYQKGVVVVKAWGTNSQSIKVRENSWKNGEMSAISNRGANPENKRESYLFTSSITTKDGNTYLFAENIKRKVRIGSIVATVITLPCIIYPIVISSAGFNKYYTADASVFKLSPSNKFTKMIDIEQSRSSNMLAGAPISYSYTRNVVDEEGTNAYFISGDNKSKMITNLNTKKVKNIPVLSGDIVSAVFPAKEGHYMLVENNKKSKSTKLSIVPL